MRRLCRSDVALRGDSALSSHRLGVASRWWEGVTGGRGAQCAHEYSARTGSRLTAPHGQERILETFRIKSILNN